MGNNASFARKAASKARRALPPKIRSMSMSSEETSVDTSDYSEDSRSGSDSSDEERRTQRRVQREEKQRRSPPNELMVATAKDKLKAMSKLISKGADVNAVDGHGRTALYHGCAAGKVKAVQFLMRTPGVDLNQARTSGSHETPLMCALANSEEIVRLFVQLEEVNVNQTAGKTRLTALMVAAKAINVNAIELLMMRDELDINALDRDNYTALHHAVKAATWKRGSDVYKSIELFLARSDLKMNFPIGKTVLHLACSADREMADIVSMILKHPDADANARGGDFDSPPILGAIEREYNTTVDLLLSRPEIDVNLKDVRGMTALCIACLSGSKKLVLRLLAIPGINTAPTREKTDGPLHCAIRRRNYSMVRLLIDREEIDVNAVGMNGETPVMAGCWPGELSTEMLLRHPRINRNARDNDGHSVLHHVMLNRAGTQNARLVLRDPNIVLGTGTKWGHMVIGCACDAGRRNVAYLRMYLFCKKPTAVTLSAKRAAEARAAGRKIGGYRKTSVGGEWVRRRPRRAL